MAIFVSQKYVAEHTRGAVQARLRAVIALAPALKFYRRVLRRITRSNHYASTAECRITQNLDDCATHFQQHGWAYIEDFFGKEFHQDLVASWPRRYEFNPPMDLTKSYDTGFAAGCRASRPSDPPNLRKYGALSKLVTYLRSPECSARFSELVGGGASLECVAFLMQMTRRGSQVVPHKDDNFSATFKGHAVNVLVFIDGEGGPNGGGLALSKDDELKEVIVEARNLKNTALIYDVKADFFHGFKPVATGKHRWSMSFFIADKR